MIAIRRATPDDCHSVWEWSNDQTVRAFSFHPEPILWEGHQRWFLDKLADLRCHYFVIVDAGRPVGQLRFDVAGEDAEVHVSVAANERGRGCATEGLRLGCKAISDAGRVRRVIARIKSDNLASIRLFEKTGFVYAGTIAVGTHRAEEMVLKLRS